MYLYEDRKTAVELYIQYRRDADAAVDHLAGAVRYYRSLSVTIQRVLTDNGACYRSKKFAAMCRCLAVSVNKVVASKRFWPPWPSLSPGAPSPG